MTRSERELYLGGPMITEGQTTETDLAWLAGFFDGEGTISLGASRGRISPIVSVVNTNLPNLGRVRAVTATLLGHDVRIHERKGKDAQAARPAFVASFSSHIDADVLLNAMYGYLVGKRRQASLVLQFLSIAPGSGRNARDFRRARGRQANAAGGYDERHWELVRAVQELNRRYGPGEWQTKTVAEHVSEPPEQVEVDPLKRWYMLRFG